MYLLLGTWLKLWLPTCVFSYTLPCSPLLLYIAVPSLSTQVCTSQAGNVDRPGFVNSFTFGAKANQNTFLFSNYCLLYNKRTQRLVAYTTTTPISALPTVPGWHFLLVLTGLPGVAAAAGRSAGTLSRRLFSQGDETGCFPCSLRASLKVRADQGATASSLLTSPWWRSPRESYGGEISVAWPPRCSLR